MWLPRCCKASPFFPMAAAVCTVGACAFVAYFFSLISCLLVIRAISGVVILNVSFLFLKHICLIDLFFFSLSFFGAAPGAMANHLISSALLRPHGTNNPYNTLLGEPAVSNNPSVSMYNAQGVLDFILISSSESPILCSFSGHILFFFLLPLFWKQTHRLLSHSTAVGVFTLYFHSP